MGKQERQQGDVLPKPRFLYHYTGQGGLDGILKDDCIWATHYRFLNDSTERHLGLVLYRETLARALAEHFSSSPECIRAWVDYLQSYFNSVNAFVLSFSIDQPNENGTAYDRLSMWRGYANGAQGYCLAFDGPELLRWHEIQDDRKSFGSTKCYYLIEEGSSTQTDNLIDKDRVTELIDEETIDLFENKISNSDILQVKSLNSLRALLSADQNSQKAIWNYITDSLCLCIALKHSGFLEESEYRRIRFFYNRISNPEPIQFRTGKCGQIPYIAISLRLQAENSPLRRIIFGPSPNCEQVATCLRIRLQQMGLPHVEVVCSDIPYRSW